MALDRDIYRAFEDVVGPENISEEPAILDSYAFRWGLGWGEHAKLDKFVERSAAILLPKDTAEVQAIVKICNKYKVLYKATCTGWGMWSDHFGPGVIKLDMRRMNRILEINEKNMYAVVEPAVTSAQLQAELMKRGLNCNIIGAGGNCSALPHAAHYGGGHMGETTSYRERNILGTEWVTPEGDIVKFGSLEPLDEWFCGDGPGPSLRGVVMGCVAPCGGLGVFTKAATKVYHWAGAKEFVVEGVSPRYLPTELPENFLYRYFSFPTAEEMIAAQRKIGESEIAFEVMGFNFAMVAANMAADNQEEAALTEEFRNQAQGPGFQVILIGNCKSDFEYKKQVLEQIINETDGKSLKPLEDPKISAGFIWRCMRITASVRECFRPRGASQFGAALGGTHTYDQEVRYIQKAAKLKAELIKKGFVRDDGCGYLQWSHELGHLGHSEMLMQFTDESAEVARALKDFNMAAVKIAFDTQYGVPSHIGGDELHGMFGPAALNYHLWLKKIKKTFDPNGVSEADQYINSQE